MVGSAPIVKPIITVYEGITEEGASFLVKLQKVCEKFVYKHLETIEYDKN